MVHIKLRKHYLILVILLYATILWGFQKAEKQNSTKNCSVGKLEAKLDPRLQLLMDLQREIKTKTSLSKSVSTFHLHTFNGKPAVRCIVRTAGHPRDIEKVGGMVCSKFGEIVTALVPFQHLEMLTALPEIIYVEAERPVALTLEASVAAVKGDLVHNRFNNSFTGYTGKGVIIGDIHSGIDFTHPDFINDDGSSRILFIWDQTDNGGPPPAGFIYGTEWTQAQINDEIDGSPAGLVRQKDTNGHGTHTAGIAAANGRATGNNCPANRYVGMAPEADLIIVKSNLETATILDAIAYIQNNAAAMSKACVINNSFSSQYGPHDGTQNWEIAFDNATGPGKVLVVSAGNNGNHHNISPVPQPPPDYNTLKRIHAGGIAKVVNEVEITFQVPSYIPDPGILNDAFEMDLWYQGGDKISVKLTTPGGISFSKSTGDVYIPEETDEGTIWINNASSGANPNNGDNECYIYVADKIENKPPAGGTWKITITGIDLPEGGSFDIWAFHNTLTSDPYEIIFSDNFVNAVLVGSPGTATKPITVAAYATKNDWFCPTGEKKNWPYNQLIGDIAWYSSPGPRRDGMLKPEITTPGSNIAAARSNDWNMSVSFMADDGVHAIKHGTSMSAAHVTGAVALLLQQNPSLLNDEVKSILTGTAVSDAFTGIVPNAVWGYGKLDIYAAMGGTKSTQMVAETGSHIFRFPNGNVVIGFTNHTGIDNVTVEMFTSSPPNPGGKVLARYYNITTTAQNFSANLTFPYTQNEFDQAGFNVGELGLYLGRSSNGGQTWEAISSTVDPVNNTITISGVTAFSLWAIGAEDAVPIELASFAAALEGKTVILEWQTVSETNNLGFEIQRRQGKSEFVKIGFIPGAGTTSRSQVYEFRDVNIRNSSFDYRLKQIDTDGKFTFSSIVSVTLEAANKFCLYPNYPNPFNTSTMIRYELPVDSYVKLKLFNVFGQEVINLVNEWQTSGHYNLEFDASRLSSGVYFLRLSAGAFLEIQKMISMR